MSLSSWIATSKGTEPLPVGPGKLDVVQPTVLKPGSNTFPSTRATPQPPAPADVFPTITILWSFGCTAMPKALSSLSPVKLYVFVVKAPVELMTARAKLKLSPESSGVMCPATAIELGVLGLGRRATASPRSGPPKSTVSLPSGLLKVVSRSPGAA